MGGVPFMMWKLPTSAEEDYDDTDSDSTFYEPEDKKMDGSKSADAYTNNDSGIVIYEGSSDIAETNENENHKLCLNKEMNMKYLQNRTARNVTSECNNTKSCSDKESLRNLYYTEHQSKLKSIIDNETKSVICNEFHVRTNDRNRIEQNDNLSTITLNSFPASEECTNNTVDTAFAKTANIDENDSMNSIMTGLVSLLQNNEVEEVETYHNGSVNIVTSNITSPSFEQRENVGSGLVHYELMSSSSDKLVTEDDNSSIFMESAGDTNFSKSNNHTEQNTMNFDNTMSDINILTEINNDLNCNKLVDFSVPTEENDLLLTNTADLLSDFDSETLNAYDQNINFMLENDRFRDVLKYQDFREGMNTTDGGNNVWSSATTNCYSVQKRKWPNPKQWPKIRKLKAISCKSAERVLPQRNCHSKCSRNNRKVCNREDFIELSIRKGKGKKFEVNIQKQEHLTSNSYMTRSISKQSQREQTRRVKRLENEHTFQSLQDVKYLEKVKTALNALSFRIKRWTSGQDEHPPTRNDAVTMLEYVERVHTNLKDKSKKCGEKRVKRHFLRVIKDAEQLFLEIKNAIEEADRLYQMEQEQLLKMTDDSSDTRLSDCISEMDDNTSTTQYSRTTPLWRLTNTEQSQFVNENYVVSKITNKPERDINSIKTMNRKEWVTNENDEVVSDMRCQNNIQSKALNNKNLTTRKSILKSAFKKIENNKNGQKQLSFSDVVDYVPEGDGWLYSSDDFSDEVQSVYKDIQNNDTKNKHYDASNMELDDNICNIPRNGNIVQKQNINNNDNTYMTKPSINYYNCGRQIEDTRYNDSVKKQVVINDGMFNQHLNTAEDSAVKLHGCTSYINQNHQQGQNNNENYSPDKCNQNINYTCINNNNLNENKNHMNAFQDNGLKKNSKQVQTHAVEKMEVESDKQYQHANIHQKENDKNKSDKFDTGFISVKGNTYIKSANNNDMDAGVLIVNNEDGDGSKSYSKVRVLPVKRRGVKKKLNLTHDGRKPNDINESGCSNSILATVSQNNTTKIQTMKNIDELESRERLNSSCTENRTNLKSVFLLSGNQMAANKPKKYNMDLTVVSEKEETNSYKSLQGNDFTNNTNKNCCEINRESMKIDKAESAMTEVDSNRYEFKQRTVTGMKKTGKTNQYKQPNNISTVINSNLKSKTNTQLENVDSSSNKFHALNLNRNIEVQEIICDQTPKENELCALFKRQQIKVTKDNVSHSISNANQNRPNEFVSDENKCIKLNNNTTSTQKLINYNSHNVEQKLCVEQDINYQNDKLIALNVPEQFKNMKISDGSEEEKDSNTSESQQFTLTNEFTFNDDCGNDGETRSSYDWRLITIMDVKKVRIKHESEYIPSSEIIFNSEELFKNLNIW